MSPETVFLKLGGSLITDKRQPEAPRLEVIARLAAEIAAARLARPDLRLVLGHGSGSFGHQAAQRHGLRQGHPADWWGYAETGAAAQRLNRLVTDHLLAAGVPAVSLQPSASARCRAGALVWLAHAPVEALLRRGLVPLVYGDVALDEVQGCTIISTEEVMAYLAAYLRPQRMILAGEVAGVYTADPLRNEDAEPLLEIRARELVDIEAMLAGSHGPDVTGGMLAKVRLAAELVRRHPGLTVRLLSGLEPGAVQRALTDPQAGGGTLLRA